MPSPSNTFREEMEEPITVEELGVALAHSKPKKAPCLDCFVPTYYKAFFEALSASLAFALNSIPNHKSFPMDTLRAYISLIPKEGKDLL